MTTKQATKSAVHYLDLARITNFRTTEQPRALRHQDGYGTLVPSTMMVQIDGKRWHRVRTTCWSNSSTDSVRIGGQEHILSTGWHPIVLLNAEITRSLEMAP